MCSDSPLTIIIKEAAADGLIIDVMITFLHYFVLVIEFTKIFSYPNCCVNVHVHVHVCSLYVF